MARGLCGRTGIGGDARIRYSPNRGFRGENSPLGSEGFDTPFPGLDVLLGHFRDAGKASMWLAAGAL